MDSVISFSTDDDAACVLESVNVWCTEVAKWHTVVPVFSCSGMASLYQNWTTFWASWTTKNSNRFHVLDRTVLN